MPANPDAPKKQVKLSDFGLPGYARDWSPQRKASIANRLVSAYLATPEHYKVLGGQFYVDWNHDAEFISALVGHSGSTTGATMLAAESPRMQADVNRMVTLETAHLGDRQTSAALRAGELYKERARIPGQERRTSAQQEEHEKLTTEVNRLRRKAFTSGGPIMTAGATAENVAKALKIREGVVSDPYSVLNPLKTTDFAFAVATAGESPGRGVVVDTHYHDAGVGRLDIPYDAERGLDAQGRYRAIQEASVMAHKRLMESGQLHAHHQRPNDMMAAIWYNHRITKQQMMMAAGRTGSAQQTIMRNLLGHPKSAIWDPAAHGLRPVNLRIMDEFD